MYKYNAICLYVDTPNIPYINYQNYDYNYMNQYRIPISVKDGQYVIGAILVHRDFRNVDMVRLKNNLFKLIQSNYIKCVYDYHTKAYETKGIKCFFDIEYYIYVINKSIDDLIIKFDMVELNIPYINIYDSCDYNKIRIFFDGDLFTYNNSNLEMFYNKNDISYIYDSSAIRDRLINDLKMKESDWVEFESQISKFLNDVETNKTLNEIKNNIKVVSGES